MRKEVFFAIIAGITIGLIIAFGAWKVSRSIRKSPIVLDIKKNLPPKTDATFTINDLASYDILTESPLVISGTAKPSTDIVVSTDESDYYTKSTDDSTFSLDVELTAGASEIKINDQRFVLVYSTEYVKDVDPKHKNTSLVGTITDISSGAIQLKQDSGDIKQLSTSEITTYVNTLKKNSIIKATDLAIGDYIVAMGYINGNKVLNAQRILVASPLEKFKTKVTKGTISQILKSKIVVNNATNELYEIALPKTWDGPDMKELEEGQTVIIVENGKGQNLELRTIFTP